MKISKAILSGCIMWLQVFLAFIVLSFIPGVRDSQTYQEIIIGILTIPAALLATSIYYNSGNEASGFIVGLVMLAVALILDAIITVPFIEIPYNGSSYVKFFTNPFLWIIAFEILAVVHLYWIIKIKPKRVYK